MRLIDLDKAIPELKTLPEQDRLELMGVYDLLKSMPTIDVELVVHGHWIESGNSKWKRCSICSWASQYYYKYCPWCGAKMEEEQE